MPLLKLKNARGCGDDRLLRGYGETGIGNMRMSAYNRQYSPFFPMATAPKNVSTFSLGDLLRGSLDCCTQHWKLLLIGALIFGVLSTAAQLALRASLSDHMMNALFDMRSQLERMEDFSEKLPGMPPEEADNAINSMMESMGEGMMNSSVRWQLLSIVAPRLGVYALVTLLIWVFADTYFLLFALKKSENALMLFSQAGAKMISMMGVWIWCIGRSFVWIPVLSVFFPPLLLVLFPAAIILGVIRLPRLLLAPIIFLQEGKGVRDSSELSMEKSKGYWGKIVGNMLVVGLLLFVVGIVAGMATGSLYSVSPVLQGFLGAFISQILFGYKITFYAFLAQGILAKPRP